MHSEPRHKFSQNSCKSEAPGKRPLIPMMAIEVTVSLISVIACPSCQNPRRHGLTLTSATRLPLCDRVTQGAWIFQKPGQATDCGIAEQIDKGDCNFAAFNQQGMHAHQAQRVSAQIKKAVINTDIRDLQLLLPQISKPVLDLSLRQNGSSVEVLQLGSWQRRSVNFSVRR